MNLLKYSYDNIKTHFNMVKNIFINVLSNKIQQPDNCCNVEIRISMYNISRYLQQPWCNMKLLVLSLGGCPRSGSLESRKGSSELSWVREDQACISQHDQLLEVSSPRKVMAQREATLRLRPSLKERTAMGTRPTASPAAGEVVLTPERESEWHIFTSPQWQSSTALCCLHS